MTYAKLSLMDAGYCTHPEHVIMQNWRFSHLRFPAMFGLIEHPKEGIILYDTGYSQHFHEETATFPNRFYAKVTPVTVREDQYARVQLAARGIQASDVRYIICSHFHADHVSALKDFPNATYLFLAHGWEAVRDLSGVRGLLKAFLPGLIPHDFDARAKPIELHQLKPLPPECAPFEQGYDLFSDGSLLMVPLPGHALGQVGLFLKAEDRPYFFVADACWTSKSYVDVIMPHPVTKLLFESYDHYGVTLQAISDFHHQRGDVLVIPSHCDEICESHSCSST